MATHSSILTWRIPWTEELGVLQSMGLQRARHNLATKQQQQQRGPGIQQTLHKCRDDDSGGGGDGFKGEGSSVRHQVEPWLLRAIPELPTPVRRRRTSFQREQEATKSLRLSTHVAPPYPSPGTRHLAQAWVALPNATYLLLAF